MANFYDETEPPLRRISRHEDAFITNLYQSRKLERSNLQSIKYSNSLSTPKSYLSSDNNETVQDQERSKKLKLVSKLVLMHLESDKYFPVEYQPLLKKMSNQHKK